uniref:G_PROTEIN_RECEP_F1_2 domain-containing protein n=1 Tax=Panagrellus redivivus TaxID=6233 RepID=A0A7E4VCC2_PANRE
MEEYARNDTGYLLDEWINEKSSMYVPESDGFWRTNVFLSLCLLAIGFVIFIAVLAWFIVKVIAAKSTSKTIDAHSTYLLTTVIVQAESFIFVSAFR